MSTHNKMLCVTKTIQFVSNIDIPIRSEYNICVPQCLHIIEEWFRMTPNRDYVTKLVNEKGWSDSELARQMGISRAEANRFMKGQRSGGKKLMSGLIKAFPNETIEALFILPYLSPINNRCAENRAEKLRTIDLVPVKNLNNTLVAKIDATNGVIEVAEHGYTTQFKVPAGTDIQVIHHLPTSKSST